MRPKSRSLAALGMTAALMLLLSSVAEAQNPRGGAPPQQGRGGGGRGRGGIQQLTLTSPAFSDRGVVATKYSQAGEEVSPPLAWSGASDSTKSFVLIVHDPNAPTGNGLDDMLHWMVWNIPGTARALPEGVPQGPTLADGARQISVSGPYYRGPAAPATGPVHHYVFELFALDTMLDVPAVGQSAAATRAAVLAAMAGHVRGKAVAVGTFRRSAP